MLPNEKHEESLSKDVGRKILDPCFRELSFAPHFSTASIVLDRACPGRCQRVCFGALIPQTELINDPSKCNAKLGLEP